MQSFISFFLMRTWRSGRDTGRGLFDLFWFMR